MEITPDKIQDILSNPESLSMLANLIQGMQGTSKSKEPTLEPPEKSDAEVTEIIPQNAEIAKPVSAPAKADNLQETIGKILPKLGGGGANKTFDDRVNLLKSIRPFMSDERKTKIDSLVKALNTAKMIDVYKDIDIFSFLK